VLSPQRGAGNAEADDAGADDDEPRHLSSPRPLRGQGSSDGVRN
jgi:hypothetical protein